MAKKAEYLKDRYKSICNKYPKINLNSINEEIIEAILSEVDVFNYHTTVNEPVHGTGLNYTLSAGYITNPKKGDLIFVRGDSNSNYKLSGIYYIDSISNSTLNLKIIGSIPNKLYMHSIQISATGFIRLNIISNRKASYDAASLKSYLSDNYLNSSSQVLIATGKISSNIVGGIFNGSGAGVINYVYDMASSASITIGSIDDNVVPL